MRWFTAFRVSTAISGRRRDIVSLDTEVLYGRDISPMQPEPIYDWRSERGGQETGGGDAAELLKV